MKPTSVRLSFWAIGMLLFLSVGRDIVANERPLYCKIEGRAYFPGLRSLVVSPDKPYGVPALDELRKNGMWHHFQYDSDPWYAPIPFSPGVRSDFTTQRPGALQPGLSPRFKNWLGTDYNGYDVAASLVGGARVAMMTGLTAMGMAMLIGIFLGAVAGFFGDNRLKIQKARFYATLFGLIIAFACAFITRLYVFRYAADAGTLVQSTALFFGIVVFFYGFGVLIGRIPRFSGAMLAPADLMIMRMAEVFHATPALILLFAISKMMGDAFSIWLIVALIGAFSWPGVAAFIRSELLRVREMEYISAARGMGFSEMRILWRHALPNSLRSTVIALAYGVAGAILIEASLSFFGFIDVHLLGQSWGYLLNNARHNFNFWWLAVPPGLAICFTVLSLNTIGEYYSSLRRS